MASCLGTISAQEERRLYLTAIWRVALGILLTLAATLLLFYQIYEVWIWGKALIGLLPFAIPAGALWVLTHILLLRYYQLPHRNLVSVVLPSTLSALSFLGLIHALLSAFDL